MLYVWFARYLKWSPRQVDDLEVWEAAKLMGVDDDQTREREELKRAVAEAEPEQMGARYANLKEAKARRAAAKARKRQNQGSKARRQPPPPEKPGDGDSGAADVDVVDMTAEIMAGRFNNWDGKTPVG